MLWDLSMSRVVTCYGPRRPPSSPQGPVQVEFNHTEDYRLIPDSKNKILVSWTTRLAERRPILQFGNQPHNSHIVSYFEHSPTMPAFLTCSEDNRARFWYFKNRNQN